MKGTVHYDPPKVVYLRAKNSSHIYRRELVAETARNWKTGRSQHNWSKRDFVEVNSGEAEALIWAEGSRFKIGQRIMQESSLTPMQLRQIAAIIGYEGDK